MISDPDAVADTQIAALNDHLTKLNVMRSALMVEQGGFRIGSLPEIKLRLHVSVIDHAIHRLQNAKAQWALAKATRQFIITTNDARDHGQ